MPDRLFFTMEVVEIADQLARLSRADSITEQARILSEIETLAADAARRARKADETPPVFFFEVLEQSQLEDGANNPVRERT